MSSMNRVNQLREALYHLGKNRNNQIHEKKELRVHDAMFLNGIRKVGMDQPIMMSKVAQYFDISAPAMSQMSRRLENLGYIKRVVGEEDRRNVYICLTEKAAHELEISEKKMNCKIALIIDAIGDKDTDHLIRILNKIRIHLDARERN